MQEVKIIVRGMTCNHCKSTVEQNIGKIPGIESASADLRKETVDLQGKRIDLAKIRERIEELGYEFGGKLG